MKRSLGAGVIAAVLFCGSVALAEEKKDEVDSFFDSLGSFSATITGTTDYVFRGISQTKEGPAIQGSFDWSKDFMAGKQKVGLFAGVWASNVDFADGDQAHIEIDYSGGIRTEVNGVSLEALAIYYNYPNSRNSLDYDYIEAGGKVGYDFKIAEVGGTFLWSPDFFGGIGDAVYFAGDVSVPLPYKFAVGAHIGRSEFDNSGATDYTDWSISISRPILGFDLSVAYFDTDLSKSECGGTENCDARAVFTVSKSF